MNKSVRYVPVWGCVYLCGFAEECAAHIGNPFMIPLGRTVLEGGADYLLAACVIYALPILVDMGLFRLWIRELTWMGSLWRSVALNCASRIGESCLILLVPALEGMGTGTYLGTAATVLWFGVLTKAVISLLVFRSVNVSMRRLSWVISCAALLGYIVTIISLAIVARMMMGVGSVS